MSKLRQRKSSSSNVGQGIADEERGLQGKLIAGEIQCIQQMCKEVEKFQKDSSCYPEYDSPRIRKNAAWIETDYNKLQEAMVDMEHIEHTLRDKKGDSLAECTEQMSYADREELKKQMRKTIQKIEIMLPYTKQNPKGREVSFDSEITYTLERIHDLLKGFLPQGRGRSASGEEGNQN